MLYHRGLRGSLLSQLTGGCCLCLSPEGLGQLWLPSQTMVYSGAKRLGTLLAGCICSRILLVGILTSTTVRLHKQMLTLHDPGFTFPYAFATTNLLARSSPKGLAITLNLLVYPSTLFVHFILWVSNGPGTISCVTTVGPSTEVRSNGGLLVCLCTNFPSIPVLRNAFLQVWPTWARFFGPMCCTIFPMTPIPNCRGILLVYSLSRMTSIRTSS